MKSLLIRRALKMLRSCFRSAVQLIPCSAVTAGDDILYARTWNSLPCYVRDMPSLLTFHRELKTVLFRLSIDSFSTVS